MADDDWESREDFDEIVNKPVRPTDKWAGEDEEVSIKNTWEDDEEAEKKESIPKVEKAVQRGKKKKFGKLKEKEEVEELTEEELAHLKIKEQKQREAQEIQIVKEAFGSSAISDSDPVTKDDFDALRKRIVKELLPFESRPPYPDFIEELIQDLALGLPAKRLKKVKTSIEVLYFEKTKAEKVTKAPVSRATKSKAKLHVEADSAVLQGRFDEGLDDYDDFM